MAAPQLTILANVEHASTRHRSSAWLTTGTVVVCDTFSLATAAASSILVWVALGHHLTAQTFAALPPLIAVFLVCFAAAGHYPGVAVNPARELRDVTVLVTLIYGVLGTATFLNHNTEAYSRGVFVLAWLQTLVLVPLFRTVVRRIASRTNWWGCPTIILGGGSAGELVVRSLLQNPDLGLRPVAIFDDQPGSHNHFMGVPVIAGLHNASMCVKAAGVRYGILAMPRLARTELLAVLREYGETVPHLYVIPDLFGISSLWVQATDVAGLLAFRLQHRLLLPSAQVAKRGLDLVLTVLVGLAMMPLFVFFALLVKLTSPGPVFFGHRRLGKGGQYFKAWKFRSMVTNGDQVLKEHFEANPAVREEWERNQKLRHDPRVTWVGRILRVTSLDECPQLYNVICDEMSLVGPRPIVQEEIRRYGDSIGLYQKVAPGITGLWQVSGRNNTTYAERVAWDEYYVRNWSAWLDLHILLRTVDVVLRREGAM